MIGRVSADVIRPSGVWAGVMAGVWQRETYSEGGLFPFWRWVCFPAHFAISLPHCYLAAVDRPDRAAPAVKGRTGATPPFLPLVRHAGRGGVSGYVSIGVSPPPPPFGVAPVQIIPAGRLRARLRTHTQAGADEPEASPIKWRYPILIFGGLCCSALGFLYGLSPCPARMRCSITPPTSTAGSSTDTTPHPPSESWSADCFSSRSGGSGLRMWEAI